MTISTITKTTEALLVAANTTLEKKQEKENLTERDEEIIGALEDFISTIEGALEDLQSVYEA